MCVGVEECCMNSFVQEAQSPSVRMHHASVLDILLPDIERLTIVWSDASECIEAVGEHCHAMFRLHACGWLEV